MKQSIEVNGLLVDADTQSDLVEGRLLPLVEAMVPQPGASRAFAFLAGPPGCGKSTLVELIHQAAVKRGCELDVVGMDGFHRTNDYLARHSGTVNGRRVRLSEVKGAPETIDRESLRRHLELSSHAEIRWPHYDRRLHEPVEGDVAVSARNVLIEGNWLLLDEPGWKELRSFASLTIFIDADVEMLKERLIARKCAGGSPRPDAEDFVERSDIPNVRRCLDHSTPYADIILKVQENGTLKEVKKNE